MKRFFSPEPGEGGGSTKEEIVTKETPVNLEQELKSMPGALAASLVRNNKQIRADRGLTIAENLKMKYKREVEDLKMKIRRLHLQQANSIDFSPTNADSLILGKDVDEIQFVADDMKLAVEIENTEIKLRLATKRYEYLFGETV